MAAYFSRPQIPPSTPRISWVAHGTLLRGSSVRAANAHPHPFARRAKQKLIDLLGRMCGPEHQLLPDEDPEEQLNRRMLMLGEEEELPPVAVVPQRGPYMSPALPTVTPPRSRREAEAQQEADAQQEAESRREARRWKERHGRSPASSKLARSSSSCDREGSCSTSGSISGGGGGGGGGGGDEDRAAMMSEFSVSGGGGDGGARRADPADELELIMVQVAHLEEQGRLVEASALLASQLGAPPPPPQPSQPQPQLQPQPQASSSHSPIPSSPTTSDHAWPEPPDQATDQAPVPDQAAEKLAPPSELTDELTELEL